MDKPRSHDTIHLQGRDFVPIYGYIHSYPSRNRGKEVLGSYIWRHGALAFYNVAISFSAFAGAMQLEKLVR